MPRAPAAAADEQMAIGDAAALAHCLTGATGGARARLGTAPRGVPSGFQRLRRGGDLKFVQAVELLDLELVDLH